MKRTLLIVTDYEKDREMLGNAFTGLEEIRLLPMLRTGREAINAILTNDIDLLMVDLFLPEADGIEVIRTVGGLPLERRPLVFLLASALSERILSLIANQVTFCFLRPFYVEIVQLRVLEMMHALDDAQAHSSSCIPVLETAITSSIRSIGVPAHLKGYHYLRDAIRIYALAESPMLLNITTDIYPEVAKHYDTRPALVEHAIRSAIEITWTRGDLKKIHTFFGYTVNDQKGKPSNLEFIAMIAERIRNRIR